MATLSDANIQAFGQAVQQPYQAQGGAPQTAQQALEQAQGYNTQQQQAAQQAAIAAAGAQAPQIDPSYQTKLASLYGSKPLMASMYPKGFVDTNGMPTAAGIQAGFFPQGSPYMNGAVGTAATTESPTNNIAVGAPAAPATTPQNYFMGGFNGLPSNFQNVQQKAPNFDGYNPLSFTATQRSFW